MLVEIESTDFAVSCFGVNQRMLEHFYNTGNDKKTTHPVKILQEFEELFNNISISDCNRRNTNVELEK